MNRLVSEVMTGDVLVARPETTFRELVRLIEDHDVGALPVVDELGRVLRGRHVGRLPVVDDDGRLVGIVTRRDLLTVFLSSDEDLRVAVHEAIAASDQSPSPTLWATVNEGVVELQGSAKLLSQVIAAGDSVRRVLGIVRVDVKATAESDDMHSVWG